jgi:hypothetical protein
LYEAEVSGYSAVSASMLPLEWFTENNSDIAIRQGASDESRKDWIANPSCCLHLQDRSFNMETYKQVMLIRPENFKLPWQQNIRPHTTQTHRLTQSSAHDNTEGFNLETVKNGLLDP